MNLPVVCPTCDDEAHVIGVEIQGVYDGVLFWRCAACGTAWHRWPVASWQYDAARPHVNAARAAQRP